MVLFPSIASADSDGQHRARARLVALRGAPRSAPDVTEPDIDITDRNITDPDTVYPDTVDPGVADPDGKEEPSAALREGRLVRRWVPAPLRDGRWEPGRPGALMLSLVAALAAVIAAVGVWWDRPVPVPAPTLSLVAPVEAANPADAVDPASAPGAVPELVVSVVGRVARPGLVRLADGARVADALDAVGGALPDTDLVGLNLARRLTDGEQVLVGVAPPPGQPVDGAVQSAPGGPSSKIDLNSATLEQLDTLPGVGAVTAQRILDWRAAHGRFRSVDQLREVSGIGEARFAQLKDLVRV